MTTTLSRVSERGKRATPVAVMTSDGSVFSWQEVFGEFAPAIASFARSRGASNPEDIVQEVFTAAVERLPDFAGDRSGLRSFLFTLAYRRVADEHRTAYRRREELVADHLPTPDESPGVEDSVTHSESAMEAITALDILGDRERRVIEMRIIQEASLAEVADTLGISNGNVRVIQARALVKVRKHLAATSGTLPSVGLVLVFVKGLRADLPLGERLAEWIGILKSESPGEEAIKAATGAGSVIAAGAATTGTIAGTSVKIGLIVALVSTAAVGSASTYPGESPEQPSAQGQPSLLATDAGPPADATFVPPSTPSDSTPGNGADASSNPDVAPPAPTEQVLIEPIIDGSEITEGEDSPLELVDNLVEPPVVNVVKNTADELAGVVDTVVDEVVEVVDTVVEVVDTVVTEVVAVVDSVVDEIVTPVVDNTAQTLSDTVDTVVDELEPVVDTVDSLVGDLTDSLGLGGNKPLSGLLG